MALTLKKIIEHIAFRKQREAEAEKKQRERTAAAWKKHMRAFIPDHNELKQIASRLSVGDLSNNTNWKFIQEIGEHLSPEGTDNLHRVTVTSNSPTSENVVLASFDCTNAIYSEWVTACSNTMWRTKNKVLKDIHGNSYPVGQMTYTKCTVEYVK